MGDKGISRVGGDDGREGNGRREQFEVNTWGGTGSKERIEAMGGRIGWKELWLVLIQQGYYGSHLQNFTDMAYIELLAFQREWEGREGGREVETQRFRNNC